MESSKEKGGKPVKKTTLGMMIASLRKENGMTQLELADKMGVTDKAVSKWERGLSCPDVSTIPKLAELFGVSVDELMQVNTETKTNDEIKDSGNLINLILKAVALAMGVSTAVLSFMSELDVQSGLGMLGIGLACIAISAL